MIIQLGAIGDIINALPVLHDAYLNSGKQPQPLLVSRPYAPILDACSYIAPNITDEPYGNLDAVEAWCRKNHIRYTTMQVWRASRPNRARRANYQIDNWHNASRGVASCFQQRPLALDRRDHDAETILADRYTDHRPIILLALSGRSSPYPNADALTSLVRRTFTDHNVIDLSEITADKPQHLLGLFDRAALLVAADTMHQHLALASSVPVIALHHNSPWNASCRRPNHVHYAPYSSSLTGIIEAIGPALSPYTGSITHITSDHVPSGEAGERYANAEASWTTPRTPIPSKGHHNDGKPFVHDIIDAAFDALPNSDAITLTNSDIGTVPELDTALRRIFATKGAAFAWRHTLSSANKLTTRREITSGTMDGGMDLIAIKRTWWTANRHKAPHQLFACAQWDVTWRDFIVRNGGGEIYGMIWHVEHPHQWSHDSAGSRLNHRVHRLYAQKHDLTMPFGRTLPG